MSGSGVDCPSFLNYKNSTKILIENLNIHKIFLVQDKTRSTRILVFKLLEN